MILIVLGLFILWKKILIWSNFHWSQWKTPIRGAGLLWPESRPWIPSVQSFSWHLQPGWVKVTWDKIWLLSSTEMWQVFITQSFKMTIVIFWLRPESVFQALEPLWWCLLMSRLENPNKADSTVLPDYSAEIMFKNQTKQGKKKKPDLREGMTLDPDWRVATPLSQTDIMACVYGGSCHTQAPAPGL